MLYLDIVLLALDTTDSLKHEPHRVSPEYLRV
jgi:hypothetical protein